MVGLLLISLPVLPCGDCVTRVKPVRKEVPRLPESDAHAAARHAVLLKEFGLPKRRTKFIPDGHYTTDPNELERLFRG